MKRDRMTTAAALLTLAPWAGAVLFIAGFLWLVSELFEGWAR